RVKDLFFPAKLPRMLGGPSAGFKPPLLPELEVTPALVSAAYKRALRLGLYWRLEPEERAILALARKLKAIKSPTLREIVVKILSKVWPEKAKTLQAFEIGAKVLLHKVNTALRIGAEAVAHALLKAAPLLVPQLGYSYMNTPAFYKPKLDETLRVVK
ncbi:MAG: hypothetical protein QXY55_05160, partial [Candidatus Korarchaeota archaeon]